MVRWIKSIVLTRNMAYCRTLNADQVAGSNQVGDEHHPWCKNVTETPYETRFFIENCVSQRFWSKETRFEAFSSRSNAFRGVCFRNELKRVWFSKRFQAFLSVNAIVLIHTERKHVLLLFMDTTGTSPFVLRSADPSKLRPQVMDLHVQKRWIVTQNRMREGREKLTARLKEEGSQTVSHAQARKHLDLFFISMHT